MSRPQRLFIPALIGGICIGIFIGAVVVSSWSM